MSNFFDMFKAITTKFAILYLRVDLLLFIRQRIHFNDHWEYIRYEFVFPFKWLKKTSLTFGPLYVKISPVNLGSWTTRRQENPLGLCNSFVTVFDAVPLSSIGTSIVSKSQYNSMGTGRVLANLWMSRYFIMCRYRVWVMDIPNAEREHGYCILI